MCSIPTICDCNKTIQKNALMCRKIFILFFMFQGELPIDYLNNSDRYKAESLFTNAQQILASFEV